MPWLINDAPSYTMLHWLNDPNGLRKNLVLAPLQPYPTEHSRKAWPEGLCLNVEGLCKTYTNAKKRKTPTQAPAKALNNVSFEVPKGQVFTILGPNGAGKTTLLRLLTTLLAPDSGNAWLNGHSIVQEPLRARQALGVVFQENHFNTYFSVWNNLLLHSDMHGLNRKQSEPWLKEQLEQAGLLGRERDLPDQFSGGQKRRLAIIRALMHQPQLLFLDEPTTGLDPEARQAVWQSLKALKATGTTIILTTHYMEEAEALSDTLLLLKQGEVVKQGSPAEIKHWLHPKQRFVLELWSTVPKVEAALLFKQLTSHYAAYDANENPLAEPLTDKPEGLAWAFTLKHPEAWPALVANVPPSWLMRSGWENPTLEEVFLNLAKETA
jgi:ABC-2 type transport system ATP-binding protein